MTTPGVLLKLIVAVTALAWIVVGHAVVPDACQLFSADDASKLMGFDVTRAESTGGTHCRYDKAGEGRQAKDRVEINMTQRASASEAHARFVKPDSPLPRDVTSTPVTGVGDEAHVLRGPAADGRSAIVFRHDAVLITIGARPAPSDSALMLAGRTVVSRL